MTREGVRAHFAGQADGLGHFDRAVAAVRGDHSLPPSPPPPTVLTKAAVLVPLVDRPEGLTVLLTLRASHLPSHAGQVALPGGRMEAGDADAIAAALRETEEEVGLPPAQIEVVGRLDTYITGTGFEITPIVALVHPPIALRLDPFEVADAFEVPLAFILDPANHQRQTRELRGGVRSFFVLPFEKRYIWGATAAMLINLAEVLNR